MANFGDKVDATSEVHVHCPECQRRHSLAGVDDWTHLTCPACGHSFFVVNTHHAAARLQTGKQIGRFELVRPLGTGGFGCVWEAYDPYLHRSVAVKFPRHQDLSASDAELFLREARAAAQVRHDNIVGIFEVGRDADLIFLISELVSGKPLDEWTRGQSVPARRAIELCRAMAQALEAIHAAGIVHRDLKPSNVLVDERGRPRLTDFGLAKRSAGELTLTVDGQILGTPAYMSPEQACGASHAADARSDLYSLGVILFELLTGTLPFRGTPHQLLAQVVQEPAPSPRRFVSRIPRDLETICLRCLEKSPDRRYQTATELIEDLERWLDGRPIRARQIGRLRRTLRWVRRKPVQAFLISLLAGIAIAGPVLAMRERWLRGEMAEAREEAEHMRKLAERRESQQRQLRIDAEQSRDQAERARAGLAIAQAETLASERRARLQNYAATLRLAEQSMDNHDAASAGELLARLIPHGDQEDLRGYEWYAHWDTLHRPLLDEIELDRSPHHVQVSSDGRWIAVAHDVNALAIVDNASQQITRRVRLDVPRITCMAFDTSGSQVLVGAADGGITRVDVAADDDHPVVANSDSAVVFLEQLPDSDGWIVGHADGSLDRLDPEFQMSARRTLLDEPVEWKAFDVSADGTHVAAIGQRTAVANLGAQTILILSDLDTGAARWHQNILLGQASAFGIHFSPDGKRIAATWGVGAPHVLDVETGQKVVSLASLPSEFSWVAFSPDGKQLAAFEARSSNLHRWDLPSGTLRSPTLWHTTITDAAWHPRGELATVGRDARLRRWHMDADFKGERTLGPIAGPTLWSGSHSASGNLLHTNSAWDIQQVWDVRSGTCLHTAAAIKRDCRLLPDGSALVRRGKRNVDLQSLGQTSTTEIFRCQRDDVELNALAISEDSQLIAIGETAMEPNPRGVRPEVHLYSRSHGAVISTHAVPLSHLAQLAFNADATHLFAVDWGTVVHKQRLQDDAIVWSWQSNGDGHSTDLLLRPGGKEIAIGYDNGSVYLLDVETGASTFTATHPGSRVNDLAFSADGSTLLVALGTPSSSPESRGEVRFWDLETKLPLARFAHDRGPVMGVSMSEDGCVLTTVHFQRQVVVREIKRDGKHSRLSTEKPAR